MISTLNGASKCSLQKSCMVFEPVSDMWTNFLEFNIGINWTWVSNLPVKNNSSVFLAYAYALQLTAGKYVQIVSSSLPGG